MEAAPPFLGTAHPGHEAGLADLEPDALAAVCAHLPAASVAALAAASAELRHAVTSNDRLWSHLYSTQFPAPWQRLTQRQAGLGRGGGQGVAPGGWRSVYLATHEACQQVWEPAAASCVCCACIARAARVSSAADAAPPQWLAHCRSERLPLPSPGALLAAAQHGACRARVDHRLCCGAPGSHPRQRAAGGALWLHVGVPILRYSSRGPNGVGVLMPALPPWPACRSTCLQRLTVTAQGSGVELRPAPELSASPSKSWQLYGHSARVSAAAVLAPAGAAASAAVRRVGVATASHDQTLRCVGAQQAVSAHAVGFRCTVPPAARTAASPCRSARGDGAAPRVCLQAPATHSCCFCHRRCRCPAGCGV